MVWLRNADHMGNLNGRHNGGGGGEDGDTAATGSNGDIRHSFDENEQLPRNGCNGGGADADSYPHDEITLNHKSGGGSGKSPRTNYFKINKTATNVNGNGTAAAAASSNGSPRRTPRYCLNGGAENKAAVTRSVDANGGGGGGDRRSSAVKALNFFDNPDTGSVTSSPKDRHLIPERWKFKTRKKRKRDDLDEEGDEDERDTEEDEEEPNGINSPVHSTDSSQGN